MEDFKFLQSNCFFELCEKYQYVDCGRISAWNCNKSTEENKHNTAQLKAILLGAGFSVTTVKSHYFDYVYCGGLSDRVIEIEPMPFRKEYIKGVAFLVFDCSKSGRLRHVLVRLGKLFAQRYITYHDVLSGQYYTIQTPEHKRDLVDKRVMEFNPTEFRNNAEFLAKIPLHNHRLMQEEVLVNKFHEYDDSLHKYSEIDQRVLEREFKQWY